MQRIASLAPVALAVAFASQDAAAQQQLYATRGHFGGDRESVVELLGTPSVTRPTSLFVVGAPGVGGVILRYVSTGLLRSVLLGGSPDFGRSVSYLGDVDHDGFPDYAVGAPNDVKLGVARGSVWRFSLVYVKFITFGPTSRFGYTVAAIGDIDQDGERDILACAPGDTASTSRLSLLSSRNGTIVRHHVNGFTTGLGVSACDVGDFDGDGYGDFLVGDDTAPNAAGDPAAGTATLFSGKDFSVLRVYEGESAFDRLGTRCTWIGDVDGDGIRDHLIAAAGVVAATLRTTDAATNLGDAVVGATSTRGTASGAAVDAPTRLDCGAAYVFSGATGARLAKLEDPHLFGDFATAVANACDVNGDGVDDFAVGFTGDDGSGTFGNGAWIYSGVGAVPLYRLEGHVGDHDTVSLASLGDVDGDGRAELLVGALGWYNAYAHDYNGMMRAYRGAELYLSPAHRSARSGEHLELATAQGPPGAAVMTAIVAVDGVATFRPLEPLSRFDPSGRHLVVFEVPHGVSTHGSHRLGFQSFARDSAGRPTSTTIETVRVE